MNILDKKVLFINIADFDKIQPYGNRLDFMGDTLFHGMRSLLGDKCIDIQKMDHMYAQNIDKVRTDKCKGFSLYGRLKDIPVERDYYLDMLFHKRLNEEKTFDAAVLQLHHSQYGSDEVVVNAIEYLTNFIPKDKIAVIDGNDSPGIRSEMIGKCVYFKRELSSEQYMVSACNELYPIAFSIPKENIISPAKFKDQWFAKIMPCFLNRNHPHEKTYNFSEEEAYNNEYARSSFAFTCRKGGWDCLRHYEILANYCMPIFTDISLCRRPTMFTFPKALCMAALKLPGILVSIGNTLVPLKDVDPRLTCMDFNTTGHVITPEFDLEQYNDLLTRMMSYTEQFLTTEFMAKYVLTKLFNTKDDNNELAKLSVYSHRERSI